MLNGTWSLSGTRVFKPSSTLNTKIKRTTPKRVFPIKGHFQLLVGSTVLTQFET